MRKIQLDVSQLHVDSFATGGEARQRGTVEARSTGPFGTMQTACCTDADGYTCTGTGVCPCHTQGRTCGELCTS